MVVYGYFLMTMFTLGYIGLAVEGTITRLHIFTYILLMPAFARVAELI